MIHRIVTQQHAGLGLIVQPHADALRKTGTQWQGRHPGILTKRDGDYADGPRASQQGVQQLGGLLGKLLVTTRMQLGGFVDDGQVKAFDVRPESTQS